MRMHNMVAIKAYKILLPKVFKKAISASLEKFWKVNLYSASSKLYTENVSIVEKAKMIIRSKGIPVKIIIHTK